MSLENPSDQQIFLLLLRQLRNMLSPARGKLDMPIFEGKYDFLQAGQIDSSYITIPERLTQDEYKEAAETFKATLYRLASFYELPLQLLYWSGRIAQVKLLARHRCGFDPEDESHDQDPVMLKSVTTTFDALTQSGKNALGGSANALASLLGDDAGPGIPPAREGIEAVLAAMVMTSYAALETLAADLWVAAVNRHNLLATIWLAKNSKKELPMDIFAHGFDLTSKMGTVLHNMKKVSFESLHDIKNLYTDTFKGELDRRLSR